MANKIQLRRDTAANWTAANPVLAQGEPGVELDTSYVKYGDGVKNWQALSYAGDPPFLQNGANAKPRTASSKLKEVVSVKDFGAVGDGTADDTAAIQAGIDYVHSATISRRLADSSLALHFPGGSYKTGTLTINGPVTLAGDGRQATFLKLKDGVATPLIVCNAVDVPGTAMDDFGHAKISGMTLVGNRVDAVTGGASHGIHCPGTAYTATTQYHASLFCFDLEVVNFTGSGIVTGDNRNLLWLNHVITRYCNANGLVIGGVDNKISNCEFGATTDAAVKLNSGGTTSWSNSYFYFCDGPCLYAANTAVGPNWFVNCVFDSPKVDCVNINGPTDASPYSFVNCRFSVPGRTKNPNGFSHIRANNLKAINIHNCYFAPRGAEEKSEYLLRLTNVGHVSWIGNHWDLADPPYKTDTISGTYTSITRSDTAGGLAINALHAENGANLAVGGNLSLQSASNADVRYVQRGTSASVNPLVRLGMAGVGVNKLQGRFGIELKKTDIAGGGLNEIFAVTPTGNILIGNPTEANATNGIQIKEGGTIFGNPVNSGFLYVEAGALKYKGSAGTVTTIAPA